MQSRPAETKQESAATTGPIQAGQNDGAADGAVFTDTAAVPNLQGKEATTQQSASQQISTEEQETSKPVLGTGQLILVIWLAGALVIGIGMQALRTGMNRGIRKGAVLPDKRIDDIFKSCRQELGIKGNIRLRLCFDPLHSRVNGCVSAGVVAAARFVFGRRKRILRYAILHELTHWKRKDHWVRILMNAIKIIWWFHPVVWLADRQIMMDMGKRMRQHGCQGHAQRGKEMLCKYNPQYVHKNGSSDMCLGWLFVPIKRWSKKRIRGDLYETEDKTQR